MDFVLPFCTSLVSRFVPLTCVFVPGLSLVTSDIFPRPWPVVCHPQHILPSLACLFPSLLHLFVPGPSLATPELFVRPWPVVCHPWHTSSSLACRLPPLTFFRPWSLSFYPWYISSSLACHLPPLIYLSVPGVPLATPDISYRPWLVACHPWTSLLVPSLSLGTPWRFCPPLPCHLPIMTLLLSLECYHSEGSKSRYESVL